jgi:2,4-dienoyl-CoA reductase-like NADH-dependent reductase (Old Yellow Enzyme family)
VIEHRIAKSAMSENMARSGNLPGAEFENLYSRWARGGIGLCITGNVMVDPNHLGEAKNVVLESGSNLDGFKKWAETQNENQMSLWVQLNHPGKQIPKFLNSEPVAPSSIPFDKPLSDFFATPRELTEKEIEDIIESFATSALLTKQVGFKGVQIHGAHGYLVSQFLSPKHNQRKDKWGGSLENRMRFALKIFKSIREKVGSEYPIGIKLNSADFQKGGFTHEESLEVARTLSEAGIDLIEISGGTYEKHAMMGAVKDSTKKREAYFLDYARDIKAAITCPLMVTGGFRSTSAMSEAIENNECDLIGIARPLAFDPDLPKKVFSDPDFKSVIKPLTTGLKSIDQLVPLEIVWYAHHLHQMGKGREPNPNASVWKSIFKTFRDIGINGLLKVRA